jgi:hypothetical protein
VCSSDSHLAVCSASARPGRITNVLTAGADVDGGARFNLSCRACLTEAYLCVRSTERALRPHMVLVLVLLAARSVASRPAAIAHALELADGSSIELAASAGETLCRAAALAFLAHKYGAGNKVSKAIDARALRAVAEVDVRDVLANRRSAMAFPRQTAGDAAPCAKSGAPVANLSADDAVAAAAKATDGHVHAALKCSPANTATATHEVRYPFEMMRLDEGTDADASSVASFASSAGDAEDDDAASGVTTGARCELEAERTTIVLARAKGNASACADDGRAAERVGLRRVGVRGCMPSEE